MKTIVLFTVLIAGFSVWNLTRVKEASAPCTEPIAYTIGIFDRRFGLTQQTFLQAIAEAEATWEKPINRELFVYSPEEALLHINLIYDYRQEVTEELGEIESEVKEDKETYRALESKYIVLKSEFETFENGYDALVEIFDERNVAYEKHIEAWNQGPRNSKSEFESLEAERKMLEKEFTELKALESRLNQKVKELNTLIGRLNRIARALDLNVEQFNTVGASRGETFAGGIYSTSAEGEKIDVYEFSSREKLLRVLAHEFGHALGLEHVEDSKAVMYKLNQGEADSLTAIDLLELKRLCAINL
ncbi:MAG: matrixin family metalloprotease [Candidatus Zambryskibacteria bacterium]|nr:matrixin family metalloprotease [Candidatus Zambryskibacteria bacterium]